MTNYEGMSTKKLKGLVLTVSAEEAEVINNVLASREHTVKTENGGAYYAAEPAELTEAEQVVADEAEAAFDAKVNEPAIVKTTTQSFEDCEKLAALLEAKVGCICEVLPFNEIEWVKGTITGIHIEKRSNKVLFIIKGDNNKRMLKAHDAKGIRISETKVELTRKTANRVAGEKLNDVELDKAIAAAKEHVGQYVTIKVHGTEETTRALIVGIVPEKRVMKVLMRMELPGTIVEMDGVEQEIPGKIVHKVFGSTEITYLEEWDEVKRDAYAKRQDIVKASLTPAEKAAAIKTKIDKAEKQAVELKAKIDAYKMELATLEDVLQADPTKVLAETPEATDDLM